MENVENEKIILNQRTKLYKESKISEKNRSNKNEAVLKYSLKKYFETALFKN